MHRDRSSDDQRLHLHPVQGGMWLAHVPGDGYLEKIR